MTKEDIVETFCGLHEVSREETVRSGGECVAPLCGRKSVVLIRSL